MLRGRLVIAERSDRLERLNEARQVRTGHRMRLRFVLPRSLGQLHRGDTVTLQVLYCPAGIEQLPKSRIEMLGVTQRIGTDEAVPILSNRLEIVVSQAMLAERP